MVTIRSNPELVMTLPSDLEIVFTSVLRHSPRLIYEAWTRPEHIRNWQGCEEGSIISCDVDLRPGGAWHYTMRMPDGGEHPFRGVYREVVPNRRLVYTSLYDLASVGRPEWLTTVHFEPFHNGTRLTHAILHKTTEMRDGHLESGMDKGVADSFQRLDEQAAQLKELSGDKS
jgi:uncharacterized protein YndB with AHSA1/START domain